tara:strand:+ start:76 stop:627 length:552 start_codon:yes stop_codon:yes gene_type:complete
MSRLAHRGKIAKHGVQQHPQTFDGDDDVNPFEDMEDDDELGPNVDHDEVTDVIEDDQLDAEKNGEIDEDEQAELAQITGARAHQLSKFSPRNAGAQKPKLSKLQQIRMEVRKASAARVAQRKKVLAETPGIFEKNTDKDVTEEDLFGANNSDDDGAMLSNPTVVNPAFNDYSPAVSPSLQFDE